MKPKLQQDHAVNKKHFLSLYSLFRGSGVIIHNIHTENQLPMWLLFLFTFSLNHVSFPVMSSSVLKQGQVSTVYIFWLNLSSFCLFIGALKPKIWSVAE